MNREILFRGKRVDNDEWVFGDLIRNLIYDGREKEMRIGEIYFEHNGDIHGTAVYKVIPETVGQYTGIVDKNGKKIFEGDILRYTWDTLSGEKKPYTYVISYNDKEARVMGECDSDDIQCLLPTFKYVGKRGEVVGNVYDNEEAYND